MTQTLGFMIEGLVAVLLMITIGYCFMLNRRLVRLRADEQSLKATISELITATEIAERAIGGLKITVHECDESLTSRLAVADDMIKRLVTQIGSGEEVVARLSRIVHAARPLKRLETPGAASSSSLTPSAEALAASALKDIEGRRVAALRQKSGAEALASAAQAFAERTSRRVAGIAA